jgi:ABC-2 type transport system ATP-binding protein
MLDEGPPKTFVTPVVRAPSTRGMAIELREVSKRFGQVQAVDHLSFAVPQGQVVALLGPNGSGKTTTISLMLGLRRPSSGEVRLFGQHPRDRRARSRSGVMLQESGVPLALTVRELITLFRSYYPNPLPLQHVLEMAELTRQASAAAGTLSGGQRQRLYFALAVCGNPDVLFLDEPTAALDVEMRQAFWSQMQSFVREGKTIVLTTHYLDEADAIADRILIIDHGCILADDTPTALKAQVEQKRVSFDVASALDPGLFSKLPVYNLHIAHEHVTLLTPQPEVVLRHLFQQGVELTHLEAVGAGLEEAFLILTQRKEASVHE